MQWIYSKRTVRLATCPQKAEKEKKKTEVFQVGGKCTRLKSESRVVQVQVDVKDSDIVVVKRYETYYKAWKDPWNYAQQSRV